MSVAFELVRMARRAGNVDVMVGWTDIRPLAGKRVLAKDVAFPAI